MEPSIIVIAIDGPIDRADVPALCDRLRNLADRAGPRRIVCDVGRLPVPDVAAVDALARLQLTARRLGVQLCLGRPAPDLLELLSLVGLREMLPVNVPLRVEPWRQPEQRKQRGRIQEERDPGDPVV